MHLTRAAPLIFHQNTTIKYEIIIFYKIAIESVVNCAPDPFGRKVRPSSLR